MTHPLQPTMDALELGIYYARQSGDGGKDAEYMKQALTDLKALMDSHVLVPKEPTIMVEVYERELEKYKGNTGDYYLNNQAAQIGCMKKAMITASNGEE